MSTNNLHIAQGTPAYHVKISNSCGATVVSFQVTVFVCQAWQAGSRVVDTGDRDQTWECIVVLEMTSDV